MKRLKLYLSMLLLTSLITGCSKKKGAASSPGKSFSDKSSSASSSTQDQPEKSAKGDAQANDVVKIAAKHQQRAGIQTAYVPSGQVNPKYGNEPGVTFYTHISDQYAPFRTKVIDAAARDATHVLDGLLYHDSDLRIEEHSTDPAGFTDHVFALCHLRGFRFAPASAISPTSDSMFRQAKSVAGPHTAGRRLHRYKTH